MTVTELADARITGGCQCGALRYELRQTPIMSWACHCDECRKQSGSAFGLSAVVPLGSFMVTHGDPHIWTRTAASGNLVDCLFCGTCGSRIAHRRHEHQGKITIKAGTFDQACHIAPERHVFQDQALPWIRPLLQTNPPSDAPLKLRK
jgi:hypothetical protein